MSSNDGQIYKEGELRNKPIRMRKGDSEESPVNHREYNSKIKLTQEEKLFRAFERGERVSQKSALTSGLGIGHLSSLVSKMRLEEGITYIKQDDNCKNEYGARYTEYFMDAEDIPKARMQYKRYKMRGVKRGEHRED